MTTDAENRNLDRDYDAVNRTTRVELADVNEISMTYDPSGELLTLTPPGQPSHGFEYDERERVTAYVPPVVSADDARIRTSYNTENQVTQVTRADGRTVTISHDGVGRVDTVSIGRGDYEVEYNPITGQASQLSAPDTSTIALAYTGDRLLSTTWSGTVTGTVGRSYDADGRLAGRQVGTGSGTTFTYDDDALLGLFVRSGDEVSGCAF